MADNTGMNDRNGQTEKKSLFSGLDSGSAMLIRILLLVLLVVVTAVLAYGLFGNKSADLIKENTDLNSEIQTYKTLIEDRDALVRDTEAYNKSTRAILDTFGAGNTPEKTILFLDKVAAVSGMSIETVEFGQETMVVSENEESSSDSEDDGGALSGVQTGDELEAEAAAAERGESYDGSDDNKSKPADSDATESDGGRQLFVYPVTFSFSSSYQGLKAALDYIGSYSERMSVQTFTSAYEEDLGYIKGSITLDMYRLSGTEKTYTVPPLSGAPLGKTDLFA